MGLFIGLKSVQEFLSSLVIFNTRQSLPDVSVKNPRQDCWLFPQKSYSTHVFHKRQKDLCQSRATTNTKLKSQKCVMYSCKCKTYRIAVKGKFATSYFIMYINELGTMAASSEV